MQRALLLILLGACVEGKAEAPVARGDGVGPVADLDGDGLGVAEELGLADLASMAATDKPVSNTTNFSLTGVDVRSMSPEELEELLRRMTLTGDRMEKLVCSELTTGLRHLPHPAAPFREPPPPDPAWVKTHLPLLYLERRREVSPAPADARAESARTPPSRRQEIKAATTLKWFGFERYQDVANTRPSSNRQHFHKHSKSYFGPFPDEKDWAQKALEWNRQFIYMAQERMQPMKQVLGEQQDSFRFRAGLVFGRLDELLDQMRNLYAWSVKYWYNEYNNKHNIYLNIVHYRLVLLKYWDVVYSVERLIRLYTAEMEIVNEGNVLTGAGSMRRNVRAGNMRAGDRLTPDEDLD